jgi:hypothetical protein
VNRLNVIRVIVSPRSSHTPWVDVIRDDVVVISKFLFTDPALAALQDALPVEEFPASPGMMGIFDAPNAHQALTSFSWYGFSSAAAEGAVDRAESVPVCLMVSPRWL